MLLLCLVLRILGVSCWDKDNSSCKKDVEVNVTQEALCCQSLQPNKGGEEGDISISHVNIHSLEALPVQWK